MTVAVLDASAVIAFLKGEAPELLAKFAHGVLVSEVTLKTLEWKLTRAGVKRKEVQADLKRLNLEVIEFNERLNPRIDLFLEHVKGLEFETLVAAGLAQGKIAQGEAIFSTAEIAWVNRSVPGLKVQLVGRALKDSSSPSTQSAAKKPEDNTQPSLQTSSQGSLNPQGSVANVQPSAAPSVILGD
jgi:PIN domain nuclease of toxin-antitoxin system